MPADIHADSDEPIQPKSVKLTKHDGRKRRCKPHRKPGILRGIVDTGATLHLLQDETTPELIDSIQSDKPVTGFSGNITQRVAREGYKHMYFYDPQNPNSKGVTLKLPVSTMKRIEDNIFSASKLVKAMRFSLNLRPDPVEGEDTTQDDWEGFFKRQDGVLYRIPTPYDKDQRMWHMYYGVGTSPSDAVEDANRNQLLQQVDLPDTHQVDYARHAADACIVARQANTVPCKTVTFDDSGDNTVPFDVSPQRLRRKPRSPRYQQQRNPRTKRTPTQTTLEDQRVLGATTESNQGTVNMDVEGGPQHHQTATHGDVGPEPEPESVLPNGVEIHNERAGTEDDDRNVVDLDQDGEWNQIQPYVRPTQRPQSRRLNEAERHRRLGHMGKCPRGGCVICQQAHGTHRRVYSDPTPV